MNLKKQIQTTKKFIEIVKQFNEDITSLQKESGMSFITLVDAANEIDPSFGEASRMIARFSTKKTKTKKTTKKTSDETNKKPVETITYGGGYDIRHNSTKKTSVPHLDESEARDICVALVECKMNINAAEKLLKSRKQRGSYNTIWRIRHKKIFANISDEYFGISGNLTTTSEESDITEPTGTVSDRCL